MKKLNKHLTMMLVGIGLLAVGLIQPVARAAKWHAGVPKVLVKTGQNGYWLGETTMGDSDFPFKLTYNFDVNGFQNHLIDYDSNLQNPQVDDGGLPYSKTQYRQVNKHEYLLIRDGDAIQNDFKVKLYNHHQISIRANENDDFGVFNYTTTTIPGLNS